MAGGGVTILTKNKPALDAEIHLGVQPCNPLASFSERCALAEINTSKLNTYFSENWTGGAYLHRLQFPPKLYETYGILRDMRREGSKVYGTGGRGFPYPEAQINDVSGITSRVVRLDGERGGPVVRLSGACGEWSNLQIGGRHWLYNYGVFNSTLTTRTSDTAGVVNISPVPTFGIPLNSTVEVLWTSGANARRSMIVTDKTDTSLTISGGVGENLPAASSAVQVLIDYPGTRTESAFEVEGRASGCGGFNIRNLSIYECTNSLRALVGFFHSSSATLTNRTNDSEGMLTIASGHGIAANNVIDVVWNYEASSRKSLTVSAVTSTEIYFVTGTGIDPDTRPVATGDPLPVASTIVSVFLHDENHADQCRIESVDMSGGTNFFLSENEQALNWSFEDISVNVLPSAGPITVFNVKRGGNLDAGLVRCNHGKVTIIDAHDWGAWTTTFRIGNVLWDKNASTTPGDTTTWLTLFKHRDALPIYNWMKWTIRISGAIPYGTLNSDRYYDASRLIDVTPGALAAGFPLDDILLDFKWLPWTPATDSDGTAKKFERLGHWYYPIGSRWLT